MRRVSEVLPLLHALLASCHVTACLVVLCSLRGACIWTCHHKKHALRVPHPGPNHCAFLPVGGRRDPGGPAGPAPQLGIAADRRDDRCSAMGMTTSSSRPDTGPTGTGRHRWVSLDRGKFILRWRILDRTMIFPPMHSEQHKARPAPPASGGTVRETPREGPPA